MLYKDSPNTKHIDILMAAMQGTAQPTAVYKQLHESQIKFKFGLFFWSIFRKMFHQIAGASKGNSLLEGENN